MSGVELEVSGVELEVSGVELEVSGVELAIYLNIIMYYRPSSDWFQRNVQIIGNRDVSEEFLVVFNDDFISYQE